MAWGEGGKGRARARVGFLGRETGARRARTSQSPPRTFHRWRSLSAPAVATVEPSGENFTQCTPASWPSRSMMGASSDEVRLCAPGEKPAARSPSAPPPRSRRRPRPSSVAAPRVRARPRQARSPPCPRPSTCVCPPSRASICPATAGPFTEKGYQYQYFRARSTDVVVCRRDLSSFRPTPIATAAGLHSRGRGCRAMMSRRWALVALSCVEVLTATGIMFGWSALSPRAPSRGCV